MTKPNTKGSPLKESEGKKVSDSSTHTENHQPIVTKKVRKSWHRRINLDNIGERL